MLTTSRLRSIPVTPTRTAKAGDKIVKGGDS